MHVLVYYTTLQKELTHICVNSRIAVNTLTAVLPAPAATAVVGAGLAASNPTGSATSVGMRLCFGCVGCFYGPVGCSWWHDGH